MAIHTRPNEQKCSRSPIHRAAACTTSETAETAAAFSPEGVLEALATAPLTVVVTARRRS